MPFPPDCLATYEPGELIASGGFGVVYHARHRELGSRAAVKLLRASALSDPDQVARFIAEARITAALSHPNVVAVLDAGARTGVPWIAYEYLEGPTLRQSLESGPMDPNVAVACAIQMASALQAAHDKGILHRDMKPENVIEVAPGHWKVTDFGIAKWREASTPATQTGLVLGTPEYISPEQIEGRPATPASDVYAVGVVLFELLTGSTPFGGETVTETLSGHLKGVAPTLASKGVFAGAALERVVQLALAKTVGPRPATARALEQALAALGPLEAEAAPAGARVSARTRTGSSPLGNTTRVRRALVGGASTVAPTRPVERAGVGRMIGRVKLSLFVSLLAALGLYVWLLFSTRIPVEPMRPESELTRLARTAHGIQSRARQFIPLTEAARLPLTQAVADVRGALIRLWSARSVQRLSLSDEISFRAAAFQVLAAESQLGLPSTPILGQGTAARSWVVSASSADLQRQRRSDKDADNEEELRAAALEQYDSRWIPKGIARTPLDTLLPAVINLRLALVNEWSDAARRTRRPMGIEHQRLTLVWLSAQSKVARSLADPALGSFISRCMESFGREVDSALQEVEALSAGSENWNLREVIKGNALHLHNMFAEYKTHALKRRAYIHLHMKEAPEYAPLRSKIGQLREFWNGCLGFLDLESIAPQSRYFFGRSTEDLMHCLFTLSLIDEKGIEHLANQFSAALQYTTLPDEIRGTIAEFNGLRSQRVDSFRLIRDRLTFDLRAHSGIRPPNSAVQELILEARLDCQSRLLKAIEKASGRGRNLKEVHAAQLLIDEFTKLSSPGNSLKKAVAQLRKDIAQP